MVLIIGSKALYYNPLLYIFLFRGSLVVLQNMLIHNPETAEENCSKEIGKMKNYIQKHGRDTRNKNKYISRTEDSRKHRPT
jgi:hypothetical protein